MYRRRLFAYFENHPIIGRLLVPLALFSVVATFVLTAKAVYEWVTPRQSTDSVASLAHRQKLSKQMSTFILAIQHRRSESFLRCFSDKLPWRSVLLVTGTLKIVHEETHEPAKFRSEITRQGPMYWNYLTDDLEMSSFRVAVMKYDFKDWRMIDDRTFATPNPESLTYVRWRFADEEWTIEEIADTSP